MNTKLNHSLVNQIMADPVKNPLSQLVLSESNPDLPDHIEHFFNKSKLCLTIKQFYLYPILDLNPKGEIDLMLINELGSPYIPFFGDSYIRLDMLINKLDSIVKSDFEEAKQFKYLEDLKPYFLEYGKGFNKGINLFLESELEPFIKFKIDRDRVNEKVFEFIIDSWSTKYFSRDPFFLKLEENIGKKEGYLYAIWAYIMENNTIFSQIFNERWQELPVKLKHQVIKLKSGDIKIINRNTTNHTELKQKKERKYQARDYALSYYLDKKALGEPNFLGEKTKLEVILQKRADGKKSGNSIYKSLNYINRVTIDTERDLIGLIGEDWKEILLELSEQPKILLEYLNKHY
ncbi:hypothetical protein [uncultured Mesonia sp.]|uniref:hypothetical protein n=1 Tax=uncultured Mesonia sp. TaxID=399731 RepID=UPI00374E2E9F